MRIWILGKCADPQIHNTEHDIDLNKKNPEDKHTGGEYELPHGTGTGTWIPGGGRTSSRLSTVSTSSVSSTSSTQVSLLPATDRYLIILFQNHKFLDADPDIS